MLQIHSRSGLEIFRQEDVDSPREALLRAASLAGADLRGNNLASADLWRADLRDADLTGADLEAANLREAMLARAVMRGVRGFQANLVQAFLVETDLQEADLSEANLYGAVLQGALLGGARFVGAICYAADFCHADLSSADFRNADLRRTDLRGTNLAGAELSGAKLEGAIHSLDTRWPDRFSPTNYNTVFARPTAKQPFVEPRAAAAAMLHNLSHAGGRLEKTFAKIKPSIPEVSTESIEQQVKMLETDPHLTETEREELFEKIAMPLIQKLLLGIVEHQKLCCLCGHERQRGLVEIEGFRGDPDCILRYASLPPRVWLVPRDGSPSCFRCKKVPQSRFVRTPAGVWCDACMAEPVKMACKRVDLSAVSPENCIDWLGPQSDVVSRLMLLMRFKNVLRLVSKRLPERLDDLKSRLAENLTLDTRHPLDWVGNRAAVDACLSMGNDALRIILVRVEERLQAADPVGRHAALNLLEYAGNALQSRQQQDQARACFAAALAAAEDVWGPDHLNTIAIVNRLAEILYEQQDYAAAAALFRRALEADEGLLRPEDPDTLIRINNQAVVIGANTADYAAAEVLYRRALRGLERTLGPDHASTQIVRKNWQSCREALEQATDGRSALHHPRSNDPEL